MSRSPIRAAFCLSILALLPCCGGGSGGGDDEPGIAAISPSTFFSEISEPMTVFGLGFGAPGAATVRLTAAAGTPFVGGTAAFVDIPAIVVDDSTITLLSPLATLCPSVTVPVAVRVMLADLTVYDSDGFIATLSGPTLTSFAPSPVPATVATPFLITGTGFGPALGLVTVEFTASAGTPFMGGTSATETVAGTITSPGTITGTTPVAVLGPDFTVSVKVTFANGSCVTSAVDFAIFEGNAAPVISSSVVGDLQLALGDRVSITVTATDAEGDNVTLRLLNPPAGATFTPIVNGASPVIGTLEWVVQAIDEPGPLALLFRTNDSVNPTKFRTSAVWTHLTPTAVRTVRFGDVTGDGKVDVVALARNADVAGIANVGEIYVWTGGAVFSGTPVASLRAAAPTAAGDQLGVGGIRLADVNGDGVLDVIAASDEADTGGIGNAGALYVWLGGGALTGTKTPDATLVAGALGANTGLAGDPLLWQVGDVDGDGIDDVVAAAPFADLGFGDSGAVFVWRGGVTLTGVKSWDLSLVSSAPAASDELGSGGILLGDLSGDGVLDVVGAAPRADGSVLLVDSGALFLWEPSTVAVGPPATLVATATMRSSVAIAGEGLGVGAAARIRLADVSGDLILDVVAPSPLANGAVLGSGLIYMWLGGGTLTGLKAQDATLGVTAPALGDALGAGAAGRLLVGDVNDDTIADVIGVSPTADQGLAIDAGGAYVWYGGAGMTGGKLEDALLTVPSPTAGDRLGSGGTRLADLTNDGILDIVSSAPLTDVGGVFDVGAVHVWVGGVGLVGPLSPFASLRVAGSIDDRLSYEAKEITFASRFADVSGDGALDIVVPAFRADISGTADVGAVYVWRGGGAMAGTPAPAATLLGPGSVFGDMIGLSSGANVALADVSGDGRFDVVAAASAADIGSALNAGAIYMWRGGATLTGTLTPTATMRDASPNSNDLLAGGLTEGVAWDLADVNADSIRDVIAIAPQSDTVAGANAGAGFYWAGGAALTGNRTPTAEFLAPAAISGDLLGASGGTVDLLFPVDVTDDLLPDVLIGASSYTGSGPSERGGLFLWQGAGGLTGTPSTTADLLAPTPVALDRLGN